MDTTTRQVASAVLTETARAYGFEPCLTDEEKREQRPEEFCECDHHLDEHHGPTGHGRCSECSCDGFRSAT